MAKKFSIHELARAGDVEGVAAAIERDPAACIHEVEENDWTPLHVVAAQGVDSTARHAAIATMLIEAGADVHARDVAGQTPLHLVAVNGSAEALPVAQVLLAGGADVREQNALGLDCLEQVVHGGEVRELLRGAAAVR